MQKLLAAFIVVVAVGIFFGLLRWIGHLLSGTTTPLKPANSDANAAPNDSVFFVDGDDTTKPTPVEIEALRDKVCYMHRQPVVALTAFKLIRPAHTLDLGGRALGEDIKGRCFLASCSECVIESQRWRAFEWKRENQAQHPSWASAALYPHLVMDRYFAVDVAASRQLSSTASVASTIVSLPKPVLPPNVAKSLSELANASEDVSFVPNLNEVNLKQALIKVNAHRARLRNAPVTADEIIAVRHSITTGFAVTRDAFFDYAEEVITHRWEAMADTKASDDGEHVLLVSKKLSNPFFRAARKRHYAQSLYSALIALRDWAAEEKRRRTLLIPE